ncbi:BT4734/BF3469 family protein [Weeksellaceae bacterium A-14]
MVVSIFKNFNEVVQNQNIVEVLSDIKTGKYKNIITYLRKSLAESKMEAYERAKKSLPAFTPSASFKGGRKLEFILQYTQIVVLDIDKLTKEQLTNAKTLATQSPYTLADFISPSVNGLKILVKINSSQENHKEAFLALQKFYEDLLALPIDKSGKDVTRLCFVSYDTDLYLNENASIYPVLKSGHSEPVEESHSQAINEHKTESPLSFGEGVGGEDFFPVYEHCVRFTEKKESYINGNRNNFVHLLACNLNRKGVPLPAAMGYIISDYNYDAQEVMATVNSAYKNVAEHNKSTLTVSPNGEISEPSKSNGTLSEVETEEEEKPSFIDRLENFLNYRYSFRYNVVSGKLEQSYALETHNGFCGKFHFKRNSQSQSKMQYQYTSQPIAFRFLRAIRPIQSLFLITCRIMKMKPTTSQNLLIPLSPQGRNYGRYVLKNGL